MGVTVRDETADAGRSSQDAFIRNSRSARLAVMRDTPKDLTMSFSDAPVDVPHLPARCCRGYGVYLQIQRLQRHVRSAHGEA